MRGFNRLERIISLFLFLGIPKRKTDKQECGIKRITPTHHTQIQH
jgi:hypothetical protein